MKTIITLCFALFLTAFSFAQTPQLMGYQAIIRTTNNQLVVNNSVGLQVSILQGSATGSSVYVERHFPRTNTNGLISINIGAGTTVSGVFGSINWANGTYFLKTETDLNGGSNYTISGTSQLLSVPYALNAKNAENAKVAEIADYTKLKNKPIYDVVAFGVIDQDGRVVSPNFTSGNITSVTLKDHFRGGKYYQIRFSNHIPNSNEYILTVNSWGVANTNEPIFANYAYDGFGCLIFLSDLSGKLVNRYFNFVLATVSR